MSKVNVSKSPTKTTVRINGQTGQVLSTSGEVAAALKQGPATASPDVKKKSVMMDKEGNLIDVTTNKQ